jgi:predicted LPLAT superfamily acyltransferase
MSSKRATHWADIGEAGFSSGILLMYGINRYLGRWPFRVVLAPVLLWYLITRRLARRSSLEYLRRLEKHTGALGRSPSWRDSFRHIMAFAETLLDKALAVGGQYPLSKLTFEGREVMLESLKAGRGGVLVTTHMGCLEACQFAAEQRTGLTLNVLVHTRHAETFNSVLRRINPKTHVNLLQVSDFGPDIAAALAFRVERGEFVVIAADRVSLGVGRTVTVPFLGELAPFPLGPWVLASALKCQVILFSVIRSDGGYRVHFEKMTELVALPRATREEAAKAYIARYAAYVEALCRRSPYDWFNFFDFWGLRSA